MTPQQFNQELAALGDVPEIIVRINSGGGDVFAANAIFTRLKDCSAKVTVKIDGWAASAATIIAMAGDTIKIARNGVFMIHDPAMTVWDTFRAEDFLKMADELKVIKQSIVNTYASKTGKKTEDIEQLMSNETWWTGDIAVENGFCDELMFEDSTTVVENSSKIVVNSVPIDVSMFKSIPTQLLNSPHNQNPGSLVIQNEAAAAERARIKGIEDLANGNYDAIAKDAKFDNPISAQEMAVKIISEQNKAGGNYIQNRQQDAENSGANGVQGAAPEDNAGENGKNVFDAAIDKLFPDEK